MATSLLPGMSMKHLQGTTRSCSLCQARFRLIGPAMVNPADIVCSDCVATWWADPRLGDALQAALALEVRTDLGVDVDVIASGICRRLTQLRDLAHTPAELAQVLASRTPD